jgi:RNA-directed DNA polymerase
LNGLEDCVKSHFRVGLSRRQQAKAKINVVRYADDFVITAATKELAEEAREVARELFKERGLALSPEKTEISRFDEGFDFLGWHFRKYISKLFIKPSKKNVKAFLSKVRDQLKHLETAKQELVVNRLIPMLRGWGEYHRFQVSKDTFSQVDRAIWEALWNWARRRYPNKGHQWIKARYFHRVKARDWTFGFWIKRQDTEGQEKPRFTGLPCLASLPIVRHTKIKGDANPFDPEWEEYFEQRETNAMKKKGSSKLNNLWLRQGGVCPICQQRIHVTEEEWALHHIVPKVRGGTDTMDNLIVLHGNCHRQLHSQYKPEELPAFNIQEKAYKA